MTRRPEDADTGAGCTSRVWVLPRGTHHAAATWGDPGTTAASVDAPASSEAGSPRPRLPPPTGPVTFGCCESERPRVEPATGLSVALRAGGALPSRHLRGTRGRGQGLLGRSRGLGPRAGARVHREGRGPVSAGEPSPRACLLVL